MTKNDHDIGTFLLYSVEISHEHVLHQGPIARKRNKQNCETW